MKHSIPSHTLVKHVDAKDITTKKIRTRDIPMEINNATSKLGSEMYFRKLLLLILKSCVQKQLVQITKVNLNSENTVVFVIYPFTLFQFVFENNEKIKTETGILLILDRSRL